MHDTLATTITSRRLTSELVVASRMRSIVFVDRRVFLDVDVALRDVGLRLVVVVVAHEVADRVVREELAELAVELGGQRLVVRQHQRRPLHGLDDVGHRERLARPRDAHQHLLVPAALEAFDQRADRLRLIAGRLERGLETEFHGQLLRVRSNPLFYAAREDMTMSRARARPGEVMALRSVDCT